MARVLVAGVAVADIIFQVDEMPRRPDKYRANAASISGGGCAANAAVAIARQGGHAMLAARLGDDAIGNIILEELVREGVDTSLVYRSAGGNSSFSSVYVDNAGERQIMNFRGSGLRSDANWLDDIPDFDIVLADNRWTPLTCKAIEIAARQSVLCVIDGEAPIDPDALEGATHVAFSTPGLHAFSGKRDADAGLDAAARQLGCWVCLTEGENGVRYFRAGKIETEPAFPVDSVDTLGAGDVWHGVFTLRLATGDDETEAIRYANAAAALKCTVFGGRQGAPDRAATEKFLQELTCN